MCANLRNAGSEAELCTILLNNLSQLLPETNHCIYSIATEWDVNQGFSQYGVGDLLLSNDQGDYIVVEIKWFSDGTGKTARTSRNKKRNQVIRQAMKYAHCVQQTRNPRSVIAYTFTNDPQNPGLSKILLENPRL